MVYDDNLFAPLPQPISGTSISKIYKNRYWYQYVIHIGEKIGIGFGMLFTLQKQYWYR